MIETSNSMLRNATGLRIPLASISVIYPGGVFTFCAADVLAPYEFAIVANWTGSPGSFATQYGLTGYNTDPKVNWFWDNAMTLPDGGGTVSLLDFTDGVPTLLDAVNFGGGGITASNAYCATACSTAQTVQLDNFLTSPPGAFDAGEWAAATITGKGTIGSGSFVLENSYARELGLRDYELKDHLGNVHVVVSDKKLSDIVSGLPEDFRAEVLTMRDYYAFGMEMPGAVYSADAYRYGFNGMERDDEVKGTGMSYDFGARVYDPRVGRFARFDPMEGVFAWQSPYSCAKNSPIYNIDREGKEGVAYFKNGKVYIRMTIAYVSIGESSISKAQAESIVANFENSWKEVVNIKVVRDGQEYTFGGVELEMVAGGTESQVNALRDADGFGVNKLATRNQAWFAKNRPPGVVASTLAENGPVNNTIYLNRETLEAAVKNGDQNVLQDISVDETGHLLGTLHPWDSPQLKGPWNRMEKEIRNIAREYVKDMPEGDKKNIEFWNHVVGVFKQEMKEQGIPGRLGGLEAGYKLPDGRFKINADDLLNISESNCVQLEKK